MTNHRVGPHHKMWTGASGGLRLSATGQGASTSRSEQGYTLVALLALMTVLAIFALAAAPSIRQQAQREREIEAIFRGEEVANAIRRYHSYQQGRVGAGGINALPTSIDKLLEGVSVNTKRVQILRTSAARDPLSESGEWVLVRPRSAQLTSFTQAVMLFAENVRPTTNDPQLKPVEQDMAPLVLPTLGIASSPPSSSSDDNATGPFIGVTPRSQSKSVMNYYGIDQHDGWVFTPLFR